MGVNCPKISILLLLITTVIGPSHQVCPQGGKKGNPSPDLSSYLQNGFHSHIDMVVNTAQKSSFLLQIEDSFNGGTKVGRIKISNATVLTSKTIHYYQATEEAFIIDGDDSKCQTTGLKREDKVNLVESWLLSKDWFDGLLDSLSTLGPVGLILYASSISKDTPYMRDETIDGFNVGHWAYCITDNGPFMDFFFDRSTSLPVRLTLRQGPTTITFSYLTFDKILPKKGEAITYPYGLGCTREVDGSEATNIPKFARADTFSMDMEAAITYQNPLRTLLTSARLGKFQGVYTYDLKNGSDVVRIINDPKLNLDYVIDTASGDCDEEEPHWAGGYSSGKFLTWPRDPDTVYNLLSEDLLRLGSRVTSMGQIDDEIGNRLDIFEKVQPDFFKIAGELNCEALITYFFPAITVDPKKPQRNQAPAKIDIVPQCDRNQLEGFTDGIPKIEMTFFNYQEDGSIDFEDRFDISECYTNPRDYTWFQVVFPNAPKDVFNFDGQDLLLEKVFRGILPFIPTIRLPEVRVSYFGTNIYITGKLLERPSYRHDFAEAKEEVLSNPTKVVIREHEEDCGEICSENKLCQGFSYCQNLECHLRITKEEYPKAVRQPQCNTYTPASAFETGSLTPVELNLRRSSKSLIHEIKDLVDNGKLSLTFPGMKAEDVYIVTGPDEIATGSRIDDENLGQLPSGDEYTVLFGGRRFNQGVRSLGLTYESCLEECQDDDDCYSISYCHSNEECTISNHFVDNITSHYDDLTSYSDGCNLFARNFPAFFDKLPGKALVLDAKATLEGISEEECAKACIEETGFNCESFDYCPTVTNLQKKGEDELCFLHVFHISRDGLSKVNTTIWDVADTRCDHFSRKLSKDYQHLVGRRLKGKIGQTRQLNDVSLESCASNCNSAEGCNSFEFCEDKGEQADGSVTSTCGLSQYRPTNGKDTSLETSPPTNRCSVYVSKVERSTSTSEQVVEGGLGLAMGLGAFIFILATGLGVFGAFYVTKRRNNQGGEE